MVGVDRGKQQTRNKRSGSKGTLLPELIKVWTYPVAGGGGGGGRSSNRLYSVLYSMKFLSEFGVSESLDGKSIKN